MRDPLSNDYYYKPTSLLHNFPDGTLNPIFKRCPNKTGKRVHNHEQVEGWAKGYGQRSKLSQVYPYKFCSAMAELMRVFLGGFSRNKDALVVEDILDMTFSESELLVLSKRLHSSLCEHVPDSSPSHPIPESANVAAALRPLPVTSQSLRQLIVASNSLPRNAEIILHE
ncbi:MAG: hypothetical protein GY893_10740, partial [bacterium]|nr:hypothetical protein [bacterium]